MHQLVIRAGLAGQTHFIFEFCWHQECNREQQPAVLCARIAADLIVFIACTYLATLPTLEKVPKGNTCSTAHTALDHQADNGRSVTKGFTGFHEMTDGLLLLRSTTASITGDLGQACKMQKACRGGRGPLPVSKATSSFFGGSCRNGSAALRPRGPSGKLCS